MARCVYCSQKPSFSPHGIFGECESGIEIETEHKRLCMCIGCDKDGQIMVKSCDPLHGDYAKFKPRFCPECGRKLEYSGGE